jgi:hydrogenase maturation protease
MKTLIVGIGSSILGDDGAGIEIARRCRELFSGNDNIEVLEIGTGGLSLLDIVQGYDRLILLDAIISGSPIGTIKVLSEAALAGTVHLGTGHEADLSTTLALGRKLAEKPLPEDVHIVAVEVRNITTFSESLSPEVEAAVPDAVAAVEKLLQSSGLET